MSRLTNVSRIKNRGDVKTKEYGNQPYRSSLDFASQMRVATEKAKTYVNPNLPESEMVRPYASESYEEMEYNLVPEAGGTVLPTVDFAEVGLKFDVDWDDPVNANVAFENSWGTPETVAVVTMLPGDGTILSNWYDVTMQCATLGASIYYTVNGGPVKFYTGPIAVSSETTFKAIALKSGIVQSPAVSYTYSRKQGAPVGYGWNISDSDNMTLESEFVCLKDDLSNYVTAWIRGLKAIPTGGKYYFEIYCSLWGGRTPQEDRFGVATEASVIGGSLGDAAGGIAIGYGSYYSYIYANGSRGYETTWSDGWGSSVTIRIAADTINDKIFIQSDNDYDQWLPWTSDVDNGASNPVTGNNPANSSLPSEVFPALSFGYWWGETQGRAILKVGQAAHPMLYDPPSGYTAGLGDLVVTKTET